MGEKFKSKSSRLKACVFVLIQDLVDFISGEKHQKITINIISSFPFPSKNFKKYK